MPGYSQGIGFTRSTPTGSLTRFPNGRVGWFNELGETGLYGGHAS
jgi:hypothetical protein